MNGYRDKLHLTYKKTKALGNPSDKGFTVYAGSGVWRVELDGCSSSIRRLRKILITKGIIVNWEFSQDYEFSNASTAAQVITGTKCDGETLWKNADNVSLKDIKEQAAE